MYFKGLRKALRPPKGKQDTLRTPSGEQRGYMGAQDTSTKIYIRSQIFYKNEGHPLVKHRTPTGSLIPLGSREEAGSS